MGAFIFLTRDVNLTIQDSQFINGTAYQGGAIYVQGEVNVTIKGVSFSSNKAVTQGGAIYAKNFKNINILEGTTFLNNDALGGQGADIYIVGESNPLLL